MERVLERLWIGSAQDLQAPLSVLGFSGVVDLRDGQALVFDSSIPVFRLTNRDGDPWTNTEILTALHFIDEHLRRGRVLVACVAGMSRSASMIIGHLVKSGWDETSAYELVRKARPVIAPVPKMLESVLKAVRV